MFKQKYVKCNIPRFFSGNGCLKSVWLKSVENLLIYSMLTLLKRVLGTVGVHEGLMLFLVKLKENVLVLVKNDDFE